MSLKVTVKHHALDQCEVLVAGRRVAYICYGEKAKLNWLSSKYMKDSGEQLTIEEKIAINKFVKQAIEQLTGKREARRKEVADLIGNEELPKDFFKHDPVETSIGSASKQQPTAE